MITIFVFGLMGLSCSQKPEPVIKGSEITPVETSPDERVTLFDPALSFAPPAEFKSTDAAELKKKTANIDHLKNIFADEDQEGLVIITYDDSRQMTADDLAKIKESTERERQNQDPWIDSTLVQMNGRQWWRFETEEIDKETFDALNAPGAPKTPVDPRKFRIRYNSYSTIFKNKLLKFTFRSTSEEYAKLKPSFIQSFRTIKITE